MAFSDPREDKKLRPSLSERWTARTFTRQVVAISGPEQKRPSHSAWVTGLSSSMSNTSLAIYSQMCGARAGRPHNPSYPLVNLVALLQEVCEVEAAANARLHGASVPLSVRGQVRPAGQGQRQGPLRQTQGEGSRDWSASSGGTSWSPSRVPRASRPSTMLSPNSAAGARRRGCGATRRPSASVSSGIVKFSCHCRLLPMMPAISALDGRVRCRWCVTAATTIPCPWPTATVRCSSGATSMRW